jgi:hypothetical protein
MQRSKNGHLRLADRPADYKRLGIAPVEVAKFEDGQRIGVESGRYEWWYFDAHLDDGAAVVVVFYTKPNVSPGGPLAPRITINITMADGRIFDKVLDVGPDLFDASKSGCDVSDPCRPVMWIRIAWRPSQIPWGLGSRPKLGSAVTSRSWRRPC